MSDKRSILILAKTREEFDEIESFLEYFDVGFLNNFQQVKLSISGGLLFSSNLFGKDTVILPEESSDVTIKFDESVDASNNKVYTSYTNCYILIDGKKQLIVMDTQGFYKVNKVKSSKILKNK